MTSFSINANFLAFQSTLWFALYTKSRQTSRASSTQTISVPAKTNSAKQTISLFGCFYINLIPTAFYSILLAKSNQIEIYNALRWLLASDVRQFLQNYFAKIVNKIYLLFVRASSGAFKMEFFFNEDSICRMEPGSRMIPKLNESCEPNYLTRSLYLSVSFFWIIPKISQVS